MPSYYRDKKLGEGTYAVIHTAKEVLADEEIPGGKGHFIYTAPETFHRLVAIKRIKKTKYGEGQEISAIREIKALKAIKNENVIEIFDVFIHEGCIHIVLEYLEFNLEQVLKDTGILIIPGHIKTWMQMLLTGLDACHKKFLIHRDIKPNNLLIKSNGVLKLADFGLTRKVDGRMTVQAITRWYRPPEMLMGCSSYTMAVDMWSVGVVFAEMFLRVPFFSAESDIEQLNMIYRALGTPSERDWPEMHLLPGYIKPQKQRGIVLKSLFSAAGDDALDLMCKFLVFDPKKRIDCTGALRHSYFTNKPHPTPKEFLPRPKSEGHL